MAWWQVVVIVLQLIWLNGILSIDNAAVLAAMVARLPADEPVPWPRGLTWLGPVTLRLLGGQRLAALKVGLLGAYAGRALMLLLANYIIQNPWLRLVGALYLIKLAADSLATGSSRAEGEAASVHRAAERGFWYVVMTVELADMAFSLDNVVAAVALSDVFWVVLLGGALGILTMRFAAGIFTGIILREPVLEAAAYLLVFAIGIELLLEDFARVEIGDLERFAVSLGIVAGVVFYGRSAALRRIGDRLRFLRYVMVAISQAFALVLWPLAALIRLAINAMKRARAGQEPA